MKEKNPLVPILLIIFVDVLGLGILLPVLPYYASAFSATPFEIGLLMAAFPAAMLVGAPVLGRWSDRFGRKPLLIASLFGTLAGYLLLAVANSLPLMMISRLIDGFTGGNIPIAQAYIADVTDEQQRAQAYGLVGATYGMGYIFGPALGGLSAWVGRQIGLGYALPALLAALFALISIVLTARRLPDSRTISRDAAAASQMRVPFAESVRRAFSFRPLALALLLSFLYTLAVQLFFSQGALFAKVRFEASETQAGLLIAFGGVINAIIQAAVIGRLVAQIGERRTAALGALLLGLGLFGIAAAYAWTWLILATAITCIGFALLIASLTSLITQLARPTERGMALGVSTGMSGLANTIAPIAGGIMFGAIGAGAPMLLGGVLALLCVVLALALPSGERAKVYGEARTAESGR